MRMEKVLWVFALACAALLFFAPFSPRTTWISENPRQTGGTGTIRHSAGWDWVAPSCGVVAVVALVGGAAARPRVAAPVFAAAIATASLAGAAAAAWGHWRDATSGTLDLDGFTTYPPPAAPAFALIAALGAGYALVLALGWLAPGNPRRREAAPAPQPLLDRL